MSAQVLITGVTGHVGAAILIKALKDGYSVRAAVRSLSSRDKILNIPAIKNNGLGEKLTFIEVPDILDPKAYLEAVKGVEYVIHVASPLMHAEFASTNMHETVIAPAVRGTINILEAALTSSSIKRVVITSSVLGNSGLGGDTQSTPYTREAVPEVKDLYTAYVASKHAALAASDNFMAEKNPKFDLITVMPSFVVGRKELAATPEEALRGSNAVMFAIVTAGVQQDSMTGPTTSIEDVALVHVEALKLPGKENRGFGVTGDFDPNLVFPILKKHFPNAVKEGLFKEPAGEQKFHTIQWDASETEKVFGIKFKSVEEQVVPVARHFLELQGKA